MADSERDPAYGPERRVPSAGADPLLSRPIVATGETGHIPRPGDDRSPWLVPALFVGFVALIAGLVVVGTSNDDTDSAVDETSGSVTAGQGESGADAAPASESSESIESTESIEGGSDAEPTEAAGSGSSSGIDALPTPGFVRLGDAEFAIEASCVEHTPLAPADLDVVVSSFFFRDGAGDGRVVDRLHNAPDGGVAALSGASFVDGSFVAAADGAGFVAQFGDELVAVNPDPGAGVDCTNTMVTNEPGQLAFPHTRIVLASCTTGAGAAGITSEGGRFVIDRRDDDAATIAVTIDDGSGSVAELVDEAAEGFEGDGRVGYSGIVRAGDVALDITVDIQVDAAATCP